MGRDSTASRIGECLPAAEHSLIAFPDPWVSYLCHWCLRHYITLLYGGLNSRKRGEAAVPLDSRFKLSVGQCVATPRPLLLCQIVNVRSKQLSGHFTLPAILRIPSSSCLEKYSLPLCAIRFDLSAVPNVCSQEREKRSNLNFFDTFSPF